MAHCRVPDGHTAGMDTTGAVVLRDGDWTGTFERLAERDGGLLWVPPGRQECAPARIDLAEYSLRDDVTIRGAGIGTSVLDFGVGAGDGLSIVDDDGRDLFYLELTGVSVRGARDGVLVRIGRDDHADAFNSCRLSFSTNNGSDAATAACRLNHVLNSRHFGVHNAAAGRALELRRFQFGGISGSTSSREGTSLTFEGYSMANAVGFLNVEACEDGVAILGEDCEVNRFGTLYGANVAGTLLRHEAPVRTRVTAAFVGDRVGRPVARTAGELSVGIANRPFEDPE